MVWILRRWTRISPGLRIIHSPDLGLHSKNSPTEPAASHSKSPASRIGKLPLSHVKEPDHHQDITSCPLSERSSSSQSLDSSAACKLINSFFFLLANSQSEVEERLLDMDIISPTEHDILSLDSAIKRIHELEMELERSDLAARLEADLMKQKMENLEELNVRLKMERDRAYSLLHDVKSVIDATES